MTRSKIKYYLGMFATITLLTGGADAVMNPQQQNSKDQMEKGQMRKGTGNMPRTGSGMMRGPSSQGAMDGMSCCGPGMMSMMGHGLMIAMCVSIGVLLGSISAAFIGLTIFLVRRSRTR